MPDFFDPLWIMSLSVFGVAAIIAAAFHQFHYETGRRRRVSRRLANSRGDQDGEQPPALARGRRQSGAAAGLTDIVWLRRLAVQSGLRIQLRVFVGLAAGLGAGVTVVLSFWLPLSAALAAGLAIGALAPLAVLRVLRARRQQRFGDQFPEAVDIIVRSLRAGHPIAIAIKTVAHELPDPIGSEFAIVQNEIVYGLDLESALRNLAMRVGQQDLPLFVIAISIQSQTGGNLTEILSNLGETIRDRIKLQRKVRVLSSEGRISAIILGSVPFVLFTIVNVIEPSFYGANWSHPWIRNGLAGALGWMFVGFAIMRKMINFKT